MTEFKQENGNTELWHTIFAEGHPDLSKQQNLHANLPKDPRCRLCKAPFAGIGGLWMKWKGKKQSSRNGHYCNACDGFLDTFPGGVETEMSLLFADIRNSTAFAAQAGPQAASERVNRFLNEATRSITDHDGFIMAFYGDCVVAVWPPGFSGKDHARKAVRAAKAVAGHVSGGAEDVPVGVCVHTGEVYIGTVQAAKGLFRDISIFGVNVNITARLAAEARAGEVLASAAAIAAAGGQGDLQEFTLKGVPQQVSAARL